MDNYLHHKSKVTVAVNDLDFRQHIKPGAVMRYFQDIATEHANLLGYGYDDLLKQNLFWVILRMSIKIDKHPKLGETLDLITYPEKPSASSVDRSYYAYNADGQQIMCGSSKWCVIDVTSHRIRKCSPLFDGIDPDAFISRQPFEGVNPKLEKMPELDSADKVFSSAVQITDLDRNVHMNNACYGDLVLNACSIETLKNRHISLLHVNFISELFHGDSFDVYSYHKDDSSYIEAKKASMDVVFRAHAIWSDDTEGDG